MRPVGLQKREIDHSARDVEPRYGEGVLDDEAQILASI